MSRTGRYADQAKRIMNVAVVNEDKNTKLIDALKFEVEELRRQLAEKEGMLGLGPVKPITVVERVEVEVCQGSLCRHAAVCVCVFAPCTPNYGNSALARLSVCCLFCIRCTKTTLN